MQESVNILGTEYKITIGNELYQTDNDGTVNFYSREIRVRPDADMLQGEGTEEENRLRSAEVFRHELFHAFFRESGLDDYSHNEQLVDWLAIQSPKIFKVFKELDVL